MYKLKRCFLIYHSSPFFPDTLYLLFSSRIVLGVIFNFEIVVNSIDLQCESIKAL